MNIVIDDNWLLQSSLTSECTEQIVNRDALLATAKEEYAKLIQVMQLEVDEHKVCVCVCARVCACMVGVCACAPHVCVHSSTCIVNNPYYAGAV